MRIEAQPAAETPRGLFRATLYRELGEDGASVGVGFGRRSLIGEAGFHRNHLIGSVGERRADLPVSL